MARKGRRKLQEVFADVCFLIASHEEEGKPIVDVVVKTPETGELNKQIAEEFGLDVEHIGLYGTASTDSYEVYYSQTPRLTWKDIELKAATLRYLEDQLTRLEDRLGAPVTFGQYVARVADVLGISRFGAVVGGSMRWMAVKEAVSFIDGQLA